MSGKYKLTDLTLRSPDSVSTSPSIEGKPRFSIEAAGTAVARGVWPRHPGHFRSPFGWPVARPCSSRQVTLGVWSGLQGACRLIACFPAVFSAGLGLDCGCSRGHIPPPRGCASLAAMRLEPAGGQGQCGASARQPLEASWSPCPRDRWRGTGRGRGLLSRRPRGGLSAVPASRGDPGFVSEGPRPELGAFSVP